MFAHLIALYGAKVDLTFPTAFAVLRYLGLICVLVIAEKHVSATMHHRLIAFIMMFVGGTKVPLFRRHPGGAAAPSSAPRTVFLKVTPWTVSTAKAIVQPTGASIRGHCRHFTPSAPGAAQASASGSRTKYLYIRAAKRLRLP